MRRFYRDCMTAGHGDGFAVHLDGRPLHTPGRNVLALPSRELCRQIAVEWAAQGETLDPATMPLTRLAATALDRIPAAREAVIDEIAAYAGSDLLCHWAEGPAELVRRQAAAWRPLLDWCAGRYGVRLRVASGVMPQPQPAQAIADLRAAIADSTDLALAGLAGLAASCGSVVLALAIAEGRLDAAAGFAASMLDELYQAERWGEDDEAVERRAAIRRDIHACALFLRLCRS